MRNSEKRVGYISKRIGAKLDLEIREGSRYDLMQLLSKKDLAFIVFIFINCRGKLSVRHNAVSGLPCYDTRPLSLFSTIAIQHFLCVL